jgi:hypothetical protein
MPLPHAIVPGWFLGSVAEAIVAGWRTRIIMTKQGEERAELGRILNITRDKHQHAPGHPGNREAEPKAAATSSLLYRGT